MNTLSICRTCPRDAADTGEFGKELRKALEAELSTEAIDIMMVHCLGGCPKPGNVAFDGSHKVRIRLSEITLKDTEWLLTTARRYACEDGPSPGIEIVPPDQRFKVSSLAPKYNHGRGQNDS